MALSTSRELLELLLEDGTLSLDELTAFVAKTPEEDLFVEYKDGLLLEKLKDARPAVRKAVSGFANADGGVLVLGFDEHRTEEKGPPTRQLSPCIDRVGADPLESWAAKAIADMAGFLSPPPRFRSIAVGPGRCVLLVAVARAPQLVPCFEAGSTKYYLRFHDSTREVPAYLISDLVLGRRQHPVLVPQLEKVELAFEAWASGVSYNATATFSLSVENVSFVAAHDVEVGLVAWVIPDDPGSAPLPGVLDFLGSHLRQHLALEEPAAREAWTWKIRHVTTRYGQKREIGPFDVARYGTLGPFRLPVWRLAVLPSEHATKPREDRFFAAFYVLPAGSPPTWFQLTLDLSAVPRAFRNDKLYLDAAARKIERVATGRPRVTWEWPPPPRTSD